MRYLFPILLVSGCATLPECDYLPKTRITVCLSGQKMIDKCSEGVRYYDDGRPYDGKPLIGCTDYKYRTAYVSWRSKSIFHNTVHEIGHLLGEDELDMSRIH